MIMKRLKACWFILAVMVLAWNCSNPGKNIAKIQNDTNSLSEPISRSLPVLPKLEEGEIHVTDKAFGETSDLVGIPLNTKENIRPVQMLVKDNFLITNNHRNDSIFMIFELPDLKCVAAFGLKGMGPEEFISPSIVETAEDSILCYIYESSDDKIYKITRNNLIPEYYMTLPKLNTYISLGDKQLFFYDAHSIYYVASRKDGKKIFSFNIDSLPQEKIYKDLAIPGIKCSWTTVTGDFGISKYYGRIAYAYKYFKRIKIIDIQTMTEKNIIFENKELKEGLNDVATLEPTNITHFWGMSPNDEYFWMLYSGRTPVDVQRDNQSKKTYIFVEKYDWNGNPVKRYKLDDWGYFCVDEKKNTLYLASTASIHSLLKYDIPDSKTSSPSPHLKNRM